MTIQEAEQLISRLAPTGECDCSGYPRHDEWCSSISKPLLIGDILLKAKFTITEMEIVKLNDLWIDVFGNVSLQQILKNGMEKQKFPEIGRIYYVLKPEAKALFEFLISLNL